MWKLPEECFRHRNGLRNIVRLEQRESSGLEPREWGAASGEGPVGKDLGFILAGLWELQAENWCDLIQRSVVWRMDWGLYLLRNSFLFTATTWFRPPSPLTSLTAIASWLVSSYSFNPFSTLQPVTFEWCKFGFAPGLLRNLLWLPVAHGIKLHPSLTDACTGLASTCLLSLSWACSPGSLDSRYTRAPAHFLKASRIYLHLRTFALFFFLSAWTSISPPSQLPVCLAQGFSTLMCMRSAFSFLKWENDIYVCIMRIM